MTGPIGRERSRHVRRKHQIITWSFTRSLCDLTVSYCDWHGRERSRDVRSKHQETLLKSIKRHVVGIRVLAPLRPPAPLHSPQTSENKPIRSALVHTARCSVIMVRDCDTLARWSAMSRLVLLERYCISLKNWRSLLPSLSLPVYRCAVERRSGGNSWHHRFDSLKHTVPYREGSEQQFRK